MKNVITPADILLPASVDMTKWSVVACDQYTSQPEYWKRVADFIGDAPSTCKIVFPKFTWKPPTLTKQSVKSTGLWKSTFRKCSFMKMLLF